MLNKLKIAIYLLIAGTAYVYLFKDVIFNPEKFSQIRSSVPPSPTSYDPNEIPAHKIPPFFVEADLGGMKVKIPNNRGYIEWVNWNGQGSDWDPNASKIKYQKTHLRGFSFAVKYPEMIGKLETKVDANDYYWSQSHAPAETGSIWIDGSVSSGESQNASFLSDKYFNNFYRNMQSTEFASTTYKKLGDKKYGMDVFRFSEVDKNGIPFSQYRMAQDYYFYTQEGVTLAFVRCPVRPKKREDCRVTFSLFPKSKTIIQVAFHHSRLPEWKNIMESVQQMFYNYEVK